MLSITLIWFIEATNLIISNAFDNLFVALASPCCLSVFLFVWIFHIYDREQANLVYVAPDNTKTHNDNVVLANIYVESVGKALFYIHQHETVCEKKHFYQCTYCIFMWDMYHWPVGFSSDFDFQLLSSSLNVSACLPPPWWLPRCTIRDPLQPRNHSDISL